MNSPARPLGGLLIPALLIGGIALLGVMFVSSTLHRRSVSAFEPSPVSPSEVGESKTETVVRTVDATATGPWVFFDFSSSSVVDQPEPLGWDLGFRRFAIIANGGEGFDGDGGVIDLGEVAFDSIDAVPVSGYVSTHPDSLNVAINRWYDYRILSHLLEPKPRVYAIRTADGRVAKLEVLSYYCLAGRPGCITFRYVYQGADGNDVSSAASDALAGGTSR